MTLALSVAVLILIIANVAVTMSIARTDVYTPNQKLAQLAIVWLLPILGAALIYAVLRSSREHSNSRSQHVSETNTEGEYVGQSHSAGHDP